MGPPVDSVQLPYQWLNSMVYGKHNELVNYLLIGGLEHDFYSRERLSAGFFQ